VGFEAGFGNGSLEVESGGKVLCNQLSVTSVSSGTGRVTVTGGQVNVNGALNVSGDADPGDNIVVEAAGQLIAKSLRLGNESTSDVALIAVRDGVGNQLSSLTIENGANNADCLIAAAGSGTLALANNATLLIFGSAKVGDSPGNVGLLEIGGGCSATIVGNVDVGGSGPGTISLLTATSELNVGGSAEINNQGRVEGIGTFTGIRIRNPGGFVSPGLSPGTLTINGDYEQGEGGTLIIEVAGLEPGQFDVLHVTGNAALAGSVELRFIDGFVPKPGDSVDFVQVDGTLTGKLSGSTLVDTGDGSAQAEIAWEVTDAGTCRLIVTDVTALDAVGDPLSSPADCGAGLCGAGVVPMLPLMCVGLAALRQCFQRRFKVARRCV